MFHSRDAAISHALPLQRHFVGCGRLASEACGQRQWGGGPGADLRQHGSFKLQPHCTTARVNGALPCSVGGVGVGAAVC
jgi:hypothetical protein